MLSRRWLTSARLPLLAAVAAALVIVPFSGAGSGPQTPAARVLEHVSQSVAAHYWWNHPDQAPEGLRQRFVGARATIDTLGTPPKVVGGIPVFNHDDLGLPQNEESVGVCSANTNNVLEGTNDYRFIVDPEENSTGWYLSKNGGGSLFKEGLLPAIGGIPSGGDPVDEAYGPGCTFYAADLNYDPFDPFDLPNGIGLYKSSPSTLSSAACSPYSPDHLADSDCWPKRRFAAYTANDDPNNPHFLDKPWMAVGNSPPFGTAVWVTYTDFGPFTSSIYAVRCQADLSNCSAPVKISGSDPDVQFSYVVVGADGRTYVSWAQIKGEFSDEGQTFVIKMRVAPAGSLVFGSTKTIASEPNAIGFGSELQGNTFRVATIPKIAVGAYGGYEGRIFAIWDACTTRVIQGIVCEQPQIKLRYSDNEGVSWSSTKILSYPGVNYFPTIDYDMSTNKLVASWYTNRYDSVFQNAQDVEFAVFDPVTFERLKFGRITSTNESEADPLLQAFFIGDYFQVTATGGNAWVGFNANYKSVPLLGEGLPIPQQDNYLYKVGE
jgi:hypothetical protein